MATGAVVTAGTVQAAKTVAANVEAPLTVKASAVDFKLFSTPEGPPQLAVSVGGKEQGRVSLDSSKFEAEKNVLEPLKLIRARAIETETPLVVNLPEMARLASTGRALNGELLIDRPRVKGKPAMPLELTALPQAWGPRWLNLSGTKQFAAKDVTIELAYTPKGTAAAVYNNGKLQGVWPISTERLPELKARAEYIGPLEDVVARATALGQDLTFDFKAIKAPEFVKSVHPIGPQQEVLTKSATAVGTALTVGFALNTSYVTGMMAAGLMAASTLAYAGSLSLLAVAAAGVAGFALPFAAIVGAGYYLSRKGGEKAGEAIDMAKARLDKNPAYLASVEVPQLPYVAKKEVR